MRPDGTLEGPRFVLDYADEGFPAALRIIPDPPKRLYVVGNVDALVPGLAVIGARKATPYGAGCARRFARIAAEKGVNVISGGARGCDSEAHRAALGARGSTVVFLGGGCDRIYPPEHAGLFQEVVDAGGAVVSERGWSFVPKPFTFRARNRLIAGLADAVLIVEAGLPSGTFSTADEALDAGKEVLVVPGAITSSASAGSNRLLLQGATPVVDDESFEDALFRACGMLKWASSATGGIAPSKERPLVDAVLAQPLGDEALLEIAQSIYGASRARSALFEELAEAESRGVIARQPDGAWGPVVKV